METLDTTCDELECCRMCMGSVIEFPEYYAIDETMRDLISNLTEISIDLEDKSFPTVICPTCYDILEQFNAAKCSWTVNQQKFVEQQYQQEEIIEQEEEHIAVEVKPEKEEEFEIHEDESQNEFGFSEEYIEDHFVSDDQPYAEDSPEGMSTETIDVKPRKPKARTRSKHHDSETKEKGKDIYQKLLMKCDECGKMIEKNRLDGHMNKHNNYRPYKCDEEGCDKEFYCKLLQRLHKTSIHTGQTVPCEICFKTFPSQRSLYAHSLRHKNMNRYHCECCDRKFNNSNSLKRHMAIHSGIREWKCDHCSASFYRKFNLDVHTKTVHEKEKSYVCAFCPKRFGYSRLLRDHCKKNHPEFIES